MLAPRYFRKLAWLTKIETTYGEDATPTGVANAMQARDVSIQPLAGEEVSRDLMLPYLGMQGVELVGNYVRIEGSVEIAGAGAVGDVPAYGALLRAAGFSETVEDGVAVEYDPVSEAFEAASIYYNHDGINHVALGARGTVTLSLVPKQIPTFRFVMTGLLGTIADQALPAVDLSNFVRGRAVTKDRTTLQLHGHNAVGESVTIDVGQQVETRHLIGQESVEIVDRRTSGTAVVQAAKLADIDWFAKARSRETGALQLQHGTTAGDIVEISAPKVEIGRPTQGQTQGIINYSLPLMLIPDVGNDELKITVR